VHLGFLPPSDASDADGIEAADFDGVDIEELSPDDDEY